MSRMTSFFVLQPIVFASLAMAGPYDSYLTTGVAPTSITAWANAVDDYSPTAEVVEFDMFGGGPHNVPANGLGPADGVTVSLGDLDTAAINSGTAPGSITVHFQETLLDGPGADFAVFENAGAFFNSHDVNFIFAELAFVEVSSNGLDYARFPAISLNIDEDTNTPDPNHDQLHAPYGRAFTGVNTTNIMNLTGVHPVLIGTPFDLNELSNDPLVTQGTVDLMGIRHIRFIDIPGDGSFTDSLGNPIFDAWKSEESGGFDLDAVGAINIVPEPTALFLSIAALWMFQIVESARNARIRSRTIHS